ncbi:MAG: RNA methyltransferase [Pseudomonadota bacterium]
MPSTNSETLYGRHCCVAALANHKRQILHINLTENALQWLQSHLGWSMIAHHFENDDNYCVLGSKMIGKLLGDDSVHQGIVLFAKPLAQLDFKEFLHSNAPKRLVVLDQVTDPQNIGNMMRSCAMFAVDAIIVGAHHGPRFTPALAKVAQGAWEQIPMITVTNLARAITDMKKHEFWCLGLDTHGNETLQNFVAPARCAIIVGAEGTGLRRQTRDLCDFLVKITMPGAGMFLESLNITNATSILLHHITNQENNI